MQSMDCRELDDLPQFGWPRLMGSGQLRGVGYYRSFFYVTDPVYGLARVSSKEDLRRASSSDVARKLRRAEG